jgi:hypothetical protein
MTWLTMDQKWVEPVKKLNMDVDRFVRVELKIFFSAALMARCRS